MSTRSAAVVVVMVAMVNGAVAARGQDAGNARPAPRSSDSRVRALDAEARRLLEVAMAASPTVARMVSELESTDLIVTIETQPFQKTTLGDVRVLAATPQGRYLRLRVRTPGVESELIAVLGHELRHTLEIAAAPQVREAASLREYYKRAGWARGGGGYFETEAALEAGRVVAAEYAASRSARHAVK